MVKDAGKAADKLVAIPSFRTADMQIPAYAGCGNLELNDEYSYSHDATYTFIIPVELDGREIAEGTATYTKEKLERMEKMSNYRKGKK